MDIKEVRDLLRQLKTDMSDEEYTRLNYKTIISSITESLVSIDIQNNIQLYNDLLKQLMATIDYNRRHPSPQRSLCFINIVDKLLANNVWIKTETLPVVTEVLNTQNLLFKTIKIMLKDSTTADNYSNEQLLEITDKLLKYLDKIRLILHMRFNDNEVIALNHLILNTIRCLYLLVTNFTYNIPSHDLNQFCGHVLGLLKCFVAYGVSGYDITKVKVSALFPSPFAQTTEFMDNRLHERKGSVNKKNRNKKNKNKNCVNNQDLDDDSDGIAGNDSSYVRSMISDSEFSSDYDSIPVYDASRVQRSVANKIRHISYETLSSALNVFEKRIIFGFWSSFFQSPPPGSDISIPGPILSIILRDHSPRAKTSALNFLYKLLLTGDPYVITLADFSRPSKQLSFTPLSQSLAKMIIEIHEDICKILNSEKNIPVLVQIIKCMSMLVTLTSHKKQGSALLIQLFNKSIFLLSHKDIQIQNSFLALAVKIFELDPFPDDMLRYLKDDNYVIQEINKMIEFSMDSILSMQSILLCGESLKLLATILKQKSLFGLLMNHKEFNLTYNQLLDLSIKSLKRDIFITNQVIQSLLCKFLVVLGNNIKTINTMNDEIVNWWLKILKTDLIEKALICDKSIPHSSQGLIIDLISSINIEIFELFETNTKYHLISVLISIVKNTNPEDEDLNCQSQAIRCLGVFQSFRSMTEDLNYLFDVSMLAIEIMDNFENNYHTKKLSHILLYQSSWTLANFCDILKKFYLNNYNEITSEFLFRIIECNLNCYDIQLSNAIQSENIKTNLVRSSGCSLYLILNWIQNESTVDLIIDSNKYELLSKIIISNLLIRFEC
ncbi:uncharacterized protein LOC128961595 [Oppia nitens]|uniref:uncharacterized protein LOC128961595 n=1 Tax=Oppia nitens TaxID=1686743 RepID=UPI0023D99E53|nr:uncharacterized protein LOC128961595 [Oppia nitens]